MSHPHKAVIRRFIDEAINQGNLSVLDELVHPDYVFRSPGQELLGAEALKAFFAGFRSAFPDLHLNIDELVVEGDKAVSSFTLTGTHEDEFMGIPATGNSINISGMVLSQFREGKIKEEWEVLDQLGLLQQLGVARLPG
jgi:steroid delta-isomerase-like uncharacterized protein